MTARNGGPVSVGSFLKIRHTGNANPDLALGIEKFRGLIGWRALL